MRAKCIFSCAMATITALVSKTISWLGVRGGEGSFIYSNLFPFYTFKSVS